MSAHGLFTTGEAAPPPNGDGTVAPAALHRLEQSAIAALRANLVEWGAGWWRGEWGGRLKRIDFTGSDAAATARDLGLPAAPAAPVGVSLVATLVPRRGRPLQVRFASLLPWCLASPSGAMERAHQWLSLNRGPGPVILLGDDTCRDWAADVAEFSGDLTVWTARDLLSPVVHATPSVLPGRWFACLPLESKRWAEQVADLVESHPRLALAGMPLRTEEIAHWLRLPLPVVEEVVRQLCSRRKRALSFRHDSDLGGYLVYLD